MKLNDFDRLGERALRRVAARSSRRGLLAKLAALLVAAPFSRCCPSRVRRARVQRSGRGAHRPHPLADWRRPGAHRLRQGAHRLRPPRRAEARPPRPMRRQHPRRAVISAPRRKLTTPRPATIGATVGPMDFCAAAAAVVSTHVRQEPKRLQQCGSAVASIPPISGPTWSRTGIAAESGPAARVIATTRKARRLCTARQATTTSSGASERAAWNITAPWPSS